MNLVSYQDSTGSYCQNCGWGSHCGTPRYGELKEYKVDGGEYTQIKICDHCRCKECSSVNK